MAQRPNTDCGIQDGEHTSFVPRGNREKRKHVRTADTKPSKEKFIDSVTADCCFLSAIGELVDNSIQYILCKPPGEPKTILITLDWQNKSLVIDDNGIGTDDPTVMFKMGCENASQNDSSSMQIDSFGRYLAGTFSRYGMGAKSACNFLGETYIVSSKTRDSKHVTVVTEPNKGEFIADVYEMPLDDGADVTSTFCRIEIEGFNVNRFSSNGAFSPEALQDYLASLRAMYYLYLEGEIEGSGRFLDRLLEQTGKSCLLSTSRPGKTIKFVLEEMQKLKDMLNKFIDNDRAHISQIDFKFHVLLNHSMTPQVYRLSSSTCCIDQVLDGAADIFPIHVEFEVDKSTTSVVIGAVFYFPRKEQVETVPYVDKMPGRTFSDKRRFMTFWMGRWLPGEHFYPDFMHHRKDANAPERCYERTFGILFVDRAVVPESNKREFSSSSESVNKLKKAFSKKNLAAPYDYWVNKCHLTYDTEVSFQGENPTHDPVKDVSEHDKVVICNETFEVGELIELINTREYKKNAMRVVGKVVRFLQKGHFSNSNCIGNVELDELYPDNSMKHSLHEIPHKTMKHITQEEFDAIKNLNESKIVRRVIATYRDKSFKAGPAILFPRISCKNSMGEEIKGYTPSMKATLKGQKNFEKEFHIDENKAQWSADLLTLSIADKYVLHLKPEDDGRSFQSDPVTFEIVPGDMDSVTLDPNESTICCVLGKESSHALKVVDKYNNTISLSNSTHRVSVVADDAENMQISFTYNFQGSTARISDLCVTRAKVGTHSAKVIVSEGLEEADVDKKKEVQCSILITVEHGPASSIKSDVPWTELKNYENFDPIDITIQDESENVCSSVTGSKLLLTSPDLVLSKQSKWEGKDVKKGLCHLQSNCVSTLFSCAPGACCDDSKTFNKGDCDRWKKKILEQQVPAGIPHKDHGFFQVGDFIVMETEWELQKSDHRKTYPKVNVYGRILSIFNDSSLDVPATGMTVEYYKLKSSLTSRLLERDKDSPEDLHPDAIKGRCFVYHKSLLDSLDPDALAPNVFFCDSEEFPKSLQATLDLLYETEETLLHARLTKTLVPSGSPRRVKLLRADRELPLERCDDEEREVEIVAEHGDEISDLTLQLTDEANQSCHDRTDESSNDLSNVQVEVSWARQHDRRVQVAGCRPIALPSLQVPSAPTHTVSVMKKQDGKTTRLCKYSINVKVKPGVPSRLKLSLINSSQLTVGETFQLLGTMVDQNGYEIEAREVTLKEIAAFRFTYDEPKEEGESVQVQICEPGTVNVVAPQTAASYIKVEGASLLVYSARLLSRPAKGSLTLHVTIRAETEAGVENFCLEPVRLDVQVVAGVPDQICMESGPEPLSIVVDSMSQQECDHRFIVADVAGNNLSSEWNSGLKMTVKKKSVLLEKEIDGSTGPCFRLRTIPALAAGEYDAVISSKRLQYDLRIVVNPRNSVMRVAMTVGSKVGYLQKKKRDNERRRKTRSEIDIDIAEARFDAKVQFHTEDKKDVEGMSAMPNVNFYCGTERVQADYISFDKNVLLATLTLFHLGKHKVHAVFTDTRPTYSNSSEIPSGECEVEVRPGPVEQLKLNLTASPSNMLQWDFLVRACDGGGRPSEFHSEEGWKATVKPRLIGRTHFTLLADPVTLNAAAPEVSGSFRLVPEGSSELWESTCSLEFDIESNIELQQVGRETLSVPKPPSVSEEDGSASRREEEDMEEEFSISELSVEQDQRDTEEQARQQQEQEIRRKLSLAQSCIDNAVDRLPKTREVSEDIRFFYSRPEHEDCQALRQVCEQQLPAVTNYKKAVEEKLAAMKAASDKLQNKTHVSTVKLPADSSALGCLSTLFLIDHPQSSDLQTALSTAFGEDLDCLVFRRAQDCDRELQAASSSSSSSSSSSFRSRPLAAIALDKLSGSPPTGRLPMGAIGRASDFVVPHVQQRNVQQREDPRMLQGLKKLAIHMLSRLLVFEHFEQAKLYCEQSAGAGEMMVGLDMPSKVLCWDGMRKVGSRRTRMGLVDVLQSSEYKDLQKEKDDASRIEEELKIVLKNCDSMLQCQQELENLSSHVEQETLKTRRVNGTPNKRALESQEQASGSKRLRPTRLFGRHAGD